MSGQRKTLTPRECLDQCGIHLDQPVAQFRVDSEPVEGPPEEGHRTFTPGPVWEVSFMVDAPRPAVPSDHARTGERS